MPELLCIGGPEHGAQRDDDDSLADYRHETWQFDSGTVCVWVYRFILDDDETRRLGSQFPDSSFCRALKAHYG